MKNSFCNLIFVIVLFFPAGCGYTTKSNLNTNFRTISVSTFENKIDYTDEGKRNLYLPLLEVKVRSEIVSRYQFDGNLKISPEANADLVLKGTLKNYERAGLRYTDNDDVQEYLIRVTVSLELWDRKTGMLVWSEPNFAGEKSYFVSGPQATTEDTAVDGAILDLARRTVERTIESW